MSEEPQADRPGTATLDALPSPLDSVADSRATARWLIASTGAVGALLLGGGPLLAVGRITDWEHAAWAGGGMLVALSGVAWAIWQISEVLVPPMTTPASLGEPAVRGLREQLDAAPWYYFGSVATSVEDLLRHRRIAANIARRLASAEPGERAVLRQGLLTAHRNIARTDPCLRWLLATAHAWQVRERLRRARRHTFLGGVLVIAGAVTFLCSTATAR
ncbi:hypothetical protein [Streptomyces griseocarneus]|uniref:hypothetical protein n=1 Tax=Streptomyces griseocarneus TaxID=51201 RepID=UPI00167C71C5|nr:hypothetical protein [Streptomyces griseocarneus]MBZ6477905.1 hypothetical protein [Streptomyces griseocarneus]GHG54324.1 hypothetical protein GCM10018779_17190 [Streptomyces griseocarneus]